MLFIFVKFSLKFRFSNKTRIRCFTRLLAKVEYSIYYKRPQIDPEFIETSKNLKILSFLMQILIIFLETSKRSNLKKLTPRYAV